MAINPKGEARIFRAKRKVNFTTVDNAAADDAGLSWEALGVLFYVLTKPDDWEVKTSHLIRFRKGGRDRMQRIMRELQAGGFMRTAYQRDAAGRITSTYYEVTDSPDLIASRKPEKPADGKTGNRLNRPPAEPSAGFSGRLTSTEKEPRTETGPKTETASDANASGEPASQASPPLAKSPNGATRANGHAPASSLVALPPVEPSPPPHIAAAGPAEPAANGAPRRSARNGSATKPKTDKPAPDPARAAALKAVFGELCEWLGLDWQHLPDNARGRLNKTAANVVDAGLTAETVARARRDWSGDWRGRNGQKPELSQVEMLVAKAGAVPVRVDFDKMW